MPHITKKIFLYTKICPRKGWLLRNRTDPAVLTLGEQFRIEQGLEIGERARDLFCGGVLVEQRATDDAAQRTQQLLADPAVQVIFEAAFLVNDYAARADVLVRNRDAWDLIEVKSKTVKALESKKDREDLIDDMAYTYLILGKSGPAPASVRLMLLSDQFRLGMDNVRLFETIDYTGPVRERAMEFAENLDPFGQLTSRPDAPAIKYLPDCKKCDFFTECIPDTGACTIFHIPRLSAKQFQDLDSRGIFHVRDIPPGFRLTDTQQRPVECMRSGKIVTDPGLKRELAQIRWPAHYLDFETTQTAYPLYPDTGPYEKIPVQYSVHTCTQCGEIVQHREFLANPAQDCRRELAESLIAHLDGDGSVLSYSSFEKQVISGLKKQLPDLAGPLDAILGRLVDLILCSKCVSHPEFRGSNSIKDVLPVLVPEMSYKDMPVANGDDALATFAYMALGRFSPEECEQKREELLRYCEQDTLAMVRIHKEFEKLANR